MNALTPPPPGIHTPFVIFKEGCLCPLRKLGCQAGPEVAPLPRSRHSIRPEQHRCALTLARCLICFLSQIILPGWLRSHAERRSLNTVQAPFLRKPRIRDERERLTSAPRYARVCECQITATDWVKNRRTVSDNPNPNGRRDDIR